MKSSARFAIAALAVLLFFLGSGFKSRKAASVDWAKLTDAQASIDQEATPGKSSPFKLGSLSELSGDGRVPDVHIPPPPRILDGEYVSSHRVLHVPPSQSAEYESGPSIPLVDRRPSGSVVVDDPEQPRSFSSHLYVDTSAYLNTIDKNREMSSRDQGTFYEQNLRHELLSTNHNGDTINVITDVTHSNDKREYKDYVTVNQFTAESRTDRSLLSVGHSSPDFSDLTITSRIAGLYGVQKFSNTEARAFTGYHAIDKTNLQDPRFVNGIRVEHHKDDAVTIGLNAVSSEDLHDTPSSDPNLPTLKNHVMSADIEMRPTDNIYMNGEYAGSVTDFDKHANLGDQTGSAYRFKAGYQRECMHVEGGAEEAESTFLTPLGDGPRDELSYFGNALYELNRYISARGSIRSSRDNLAGYKRDTIHRDEPELDVTLKPSEYYKDLRLDLFYQPLHEYAEDTTFLNHYKTLIWTELHQKAGAMRYFAALSSMEDRDNVAKANDKNIGKMDLKLTWEYDAMRSLYGLYSLEQLSYLGMGGQDRTWIYGLGGKSQFHEDLSLTLDYTHEIDQQRDSSLDSNHDRVNLAFTKEYNNSARFILDFEGANNSFALTGRSFRDLTARLRFLRAF
ncbi:MAG: hypothetical protein HQM09_00780 [Candidatus Riflebacteria bacterium]|nr:hypothetical protein [Candidatus Riflebacteria bacterium]